MQSIKAAKAIYLSRSGRVAALSGGQYPEELGGFGLVESRSVS